MNLQELNTQLVAIIESDLSYGVQVDECLKILQRFKEAKGTQLEAIVLLDSLRDKARKANDEPQEDMIMEVMDFVAGFCNSYQRIWETVISDW